MTRWMLPNGPLKIIGINFWEIEILKTPSNADKFGA